MNDNKVPNETPLHIRQADGLRALAAMIEQHPEVAPHARLRNLYAFHVNSADDHAVVARAALASGAQVDKDVSDTQYNLVLTFGREVGAYVLANRSDVCERVRVGTETRVEHDPKDVEEALKRLPEREVEVPVYEWQCRPLLAGGEDQ